MTDLNQSNWSETDSSNNSASPNGWASGTMLPSQVEPTARAMMGAMKRWHNQISPTATSAGTANAQTLTHSVAHTALVAGDRFAFFVGAGLSNTGAATLNIDGLGAKSVVSPAGVALTGGELVGGGYAEVVYDGTNFRLITPQPLSVQSWTPTDASGASLALTTADTVYVKHGRVVTVSGKVTWPTTVSGATAGIGGLPFGSRNGSATYIGGGAPASNNTGINITIGLQNNSTIFQFIDLNGNLLTNSQLSGKSLTFTFDYISQT